MRTLAHACCLCNKCTTHPELAHRAPVLRTRLVSARLCEDNALREDQRLVLADMYSNSLLFGWQAFDQAEKAGAYALIIQDTHDAATCARSEPTRPLRRASLRRIAVIRRS